MPTTSHVCTITLDHLNLALSKPWSTCSCLIAVALPGKVTSCGASSATVDGKEVWWDANDTGKLMGRFDEMHGKNLAPLDDIRAELRQHLPLTFEVFEEKPLA